MITRIKAWPIMPKVADWAGGLRADTNVALRYGYFSCRQSSGRTMPRTHAAFVAASQGPVGRYPTYNVYEMPKYTKPAYQVEGAADDKRRSSEFTFAVRSLARVCRPPCPQRARMGVADFESIDFSRFEQRVFNHSRDLVQHRAVPRRQYRPSLSALAACTAGHLGNPGLDCCILP